VTVDGDVVTYDPNAPKPVAPPRTPEMIRADEGYQKIRASVDRAVSAYRAANNGNTPPTPEAAVAYFATPQEGADFVEWIELKKAAERSARAQP
jgi:hypothetical protein